MCVCHKLIFWVRGSYRPPPPSGHQSICIHSATKAAVEQKKADPNSKISVFNKRKQVAKLALKRAELIVKKAAAAKQAAAAKLLLT